METKTYKGDKIKKLFDAHAPIGGQHVLMSWFSKNESVLPSILDFKAIEREGIPGMPSPQSNKTTIFGYTVGDPSTRISIRKLDWDKYDEVVIAFDKRSSLQEIPSVGNRNWLVAKKPSVPQMNNKGLATAAQQLNQGTNGIATSVDTLRSDFDNFIKAAIPSLNAVNGISQEFRETTVKVEVIKEKTEKNSEELAELRREVAILKRREAKARGISDEDLQYEIEQQKVLEDAEARQAELKRKFNRS